jgi:DNA-directed RNA polymerase subunit RPC12/RpoP
VEEDSLYETVYDRLGNDATRELVEDDFLLHVVKHTLATLKTVKIDKLNGKFVTAQPSPQSVKLDAMWADFCQEFKDDENMVLSLNECCVCFTVTKTTTNCGHAVCLDCISKLQPEAIADEMRNNINCPMCRQRIMALN